MVEPAGATCTVVRIWDTSTPAAVYIGDNSGADRSLSVVVSGLGQVTAKVTCEASGRAATVSVAFTVVSPDACELPMTPDGTSVTGTWTTGCTSSQRGDDDQTPYNARSYAFTLPEAATVTVVVTSEQATDVYLLDRGDDSGKPLHEASSSGGRASTATIRKLLNPGGMLGRYAVEVANRTDRTTGSFTISVAATNACPADQTYMSAFAGGTDSGCRPRVCAYPLFRDPGTQRCREASYRYTAAIIDGVVSAAQDVIDDNDDAECVTRAADPVTANELASYVLAIPIRELQKDNPSLMDLSRWDSLFQNLGNIGLFSRGTQAGEPRAHWSPGVGPWQLDLWWRVKAWDHAQRSNVNMAAEAVAKHVFDGLCAGPDQLKRALKTWLACTSQKRFGEDPTINHCVPIAETIYDDANDSLRIREVDGSDVDGGVQPRRCRWGTDGTPFGCYWYDIDNAEGDATVYARDGTQESCSKEESPGCSGLWYRITPLPYGFVSFTDTDGTKYAAFPADDIGETGTGTGYSETLIRGVPADKYARESTLGDGRGWFVGAVGTRVLYIEHCPASGSCGWHRV